MHIRYCVCGYIFLVKLKQSVASLNDRSCNKKKMAKYEDVDWAKIREKLPFEKTDEQKEKRKELFNRFDPNGKLLLPGGPKTDLLKHVGS